MMPFEEGGRDVEQVFIFRYCIYGQSNVIAAPLFLSRFVTKRSRFEKRCDHSRDSHPEHFHAQLSARCDMLRQLLLRRTWS